jgi:hypothetical protein
MIGIISDSIHLNDTIGSEFDKKGNAMEYCFRSLNGKCDFIIYKNQKLFLTAYYDSGSVYNKKVKKISISPYTLMDTITYKVESVSKPRRSGIWKYYDSNGIVVKKIDYNKRW